MVVKSIETGVSIVENSRSRWLIGTILVVKL